jgi:hypothetical protein
MVAGDRSSPAARADEALEGLSEADRALVLEARRRLRARQQQPDMSETLTRRVESELGIEPEEKDRGPRRS